MQRLCALDGLYVNEQIFVEDASCHNVSYGSFIHISCGHLALIFVSIMLHYLHISCVQVARGGGDMALTVVSPLPVAVGC